MSWKLLRVLRSCVGIYMPGDTICIDEVHVIGPGEVYDLILRGPDDLTFKYRVGFDELSGAFSIAGSQIIEGYTAFDKTRCLDALNAHNAASGTTCGVCLHEHDGTMCAAGHCSFVLPQRLLDPRNELLLRDLIAENVTALLIETIALSKRLKEVFQRHQAS